LAVLESFAKRYRQAYLTTLNLPGTYLPDGKASAFYNTAMIITDEGEAVAVGAKISPQSFEMEHRDTRAPKVNVIPYTHFWRVPLSVGEASVSVVVAVCSDLLYWVTGIAGEPETVADGLLVPANFGRGAERGADAILRWLTADHRFQWAALANPGQTVREGRKPLTRAVSVKMESGPAGSGTGSNLERWRIVREHLVLVPDEAVPSFVEMCNWTDVPSGRIMMPTSRAPAVPAVLDWPSAPIAVLRQERVR
jgi:hypothetical protein